MRPALVALLVVACTNPVAGGGDDDDTPAPATNDGGAGDAGTPDVDAGAAADAGAPGDDAGSAPQASFVGGPCATNADCDYEGGVCRNDVEGGVCTLPCDLYCPDQDGAPTTFCVADAALPSELAGLGDGACVSRCDTGAFPDTGGCRDGFGCVVAPRANDLDTERYVCLPGLPSELTDCQLELAALGVSFEPTARADESPDGHPELTCHIEEPVLIHPPIHGVDVVYYDGTATPNLLAACNMAIALTQTVDDVAAHGATVLRHIGTYNCRTIAGSSSLSRHAYGDAIDVYGFEVDGALYTVLDDFEDGVDDPQTTGGQFLYDAVHRWYEAYLWSILLTPNYNAAHDNHFHVDLTPDDHFLGYVDDAPLLTRAIVND